MSYAWHAVDGLVLVTDESRGMVDVPIVLPEPLAGGCLKVWAKWREAIADAAEAARIPAEWVGAMVWRESGGSASIRSFDHGVGLLQITNPGLKGGHSDDELCDPALNLSIGCSYIANLSSRYRGDFPSVSAAFNAGSARKRAHPDGGFELVCTGNHVDAEVRALNTIVLHERDDLAAMWARASDMQFDLTQLVDLRPHRLDE
jgi:hypothetical protein